MANKKHSAEQARSHKPPKHEQIRAIAEALAALVPDSHSAAWEWIVWREWARSPEHARRIAERESVRVTRIGRDVYGHRADLDALAARNVIVAGAANDTDDETDPEVAAMFAGGRR